MSEMLVEMKTTVVLKTWETPNFARLDLSPTINRTGPDQACTIAIKDLPQETLDNLAAAWLADLYQKAGRNCPYAQVYPSERK